MNLMNNNMIFNKAIYIFIFLTLAFITNGQEQLRPLNSNAALPKVISANNVLSKPQTTSMQLPFFEDFSSACKSPYPSPALWLDSNVYINMGFGIAPLSIGVATFDGLNKLGYPYNLLATQGTSTSADTITSQPINLYSIAISTLTTKYYQPSDSIFMTFYYQAEGFGDAPAPDDSICLDFYKPLVGHWVKVWGKAGYNPSPTDSSFNRVRVGVLDTAYFHDGFKFRFRNKATASGSIDHWHLDYIQLKDQYYFDDTLLNDIGFVYKPSSFLKNYSTMPLRQYNASIETATSFQNYIRNNYNIPVASNYSYTIKDQNNVFMPVDNYGPINNPGILPYNTNGYFNGIAAKPNFTLQPFPNTSSFVDSVSYTIQHILSPGGLHAENDTLTHIQKFSNYYAYDDGSAEKAFYLNTYGAKTAMRFTLNVSDTLKAVRIYFDPILDNGLILGSTFRIAVWSSNGGSPGALIYKDSLRTPAYLSGSYNLFATYKLTSCLPLTAGSYFIGIIQTTSQALNIGFDKNTNYSSALYYNVTGNWVQSAIKGSLMINPVMGCVETVTVSVNELKNKTSFTVYPNPAQETITIKHIGNQLQNFNVEILNTIGQVVHTTSATSHSTVDVSSLNNGVYFIRIKGSNQAVSLQKLIISK